MLAAGAAAASKNSRPHVARKASAQPSSSQAASGQAEAPPKPRRAVDPKVYVAYRDGAVTQQLVLHVDDSGGQDKFRALINLLNARQAGVAIVCFSLPDILRLDTRGKSIEDIRFRLDSFAVHAPETPVLLVGTHKDAVAPGDLKKVSATLDKEFGSCLVKLVRNAEEDNLAFYGVENSKGIKGDATIRNLVLAIERSARELPSMRMRVPPGWIAVFDELSKEKAVQPHLTRSRLVEIATRLRLPSVIMLCRSAT